MAKRIYSYVAKDICTNPENTMKAYPIMSYGNWCVFVRLRDPENEVYTYHFGYCENGKYTGYIRSKQLAKPIRIFNSYVATITGGDSK